MMIYDCFNFYNELDLLDIRLHELDSTVDKCVIVEGTVTFTNKKKPLFYAENKSKFRQFNKKIIHVIVDDSPNVFGNPWIIEHHQFDAVIRGLTSCKPQDTILLSCADEIPKKERILEWKDKPARLKAFEQQMSYYFLNYFIQDSPPWWGTRMLSYKDLLTYPSAYITRFSPVDILIPDGGWHFAFVGGVKKIRSKLAAYSHQEYNNPKFNTPEKILIAMSKGEDLFQQGFKYKAVDYSLLPNYVIANIDKFKDYLVPPIKKNTIIKQLEIHSLYLVSYMRQILSAIYIYLVNKKRKYFKVF